MVLQIEVSLFYPILILLGFFFCMGFRVKLFGMLGGMLWGLTFAYMTANNAQLIDSVGTTNPIVLMSFSVIGTNFMYGTFGLIMALFGFFIAIFYVRLN